MNREELRAEDFSYDLPEDRIAKYPLLHRNSSKLLSYKNGSIREDTFSNLQAHLPDKAILVFNNTKVLTARLFFRKATGAKIEVFCLEPYESTIEEVLTATEQCRWQCMVGNLKRFKANDVLELKIAGTVLRARLIEKRKTAVIVQFDWEGGVEFSRVLEEAGEIPLPPYLNRETEKEDQSNYQTVYAERKGAVAAPTAGLHFIPQQLEKLKRNGHELAYLTLYVGAGTFRPVKADQLVKHNMHAERIVVERLVLEQLLSKEKIISVGTTSLRSLESLYWLAVKMKLTDNVNENMVAQEDAYELSSSWNWKEAVHYLLKVLDETGKEAFDFHSALFIMPGYKWKVVDGLITNFHQPKSTLLALVSAWIGEDWKKVYDYALQHEFRFLSYGDSSILLKD